MSFNVSTPSHFAPSVDDPSKTILNSTDSVWMNSSLFWGKHVSLLKIVRKFPTG